MSYSKRSNTFLYLNKTPFENSLRNLRTKATNSWNVVIKFYERVSNRHDFKESTCQRASSTHTHTQKVPNKLNNKKTEQTNKLTMPLNCRRMKDVAKKPNKKAKEKDTEINIVKFMNESESESENRYWVRLELLLLAGHTFSVVPDLDRDPDPGSQSDSEPG